MLVLGQIHTALALVGAIKSVEKHPSKHRYCYCGEVGNEALGIPLCVMVKIECGGQQILTVWGNRFLSKLSSFHP